MKGSWKEVHYDSHIRTLAMDVPGGALIMVKQITEQSIAVTFIPNTNVEKLLHFRGECKQLSSVSASEKSRRSHGY